MVAHLCSRLADLVPQGTCRVVAWFMLSIFYKAPVADDFVQQPSRKQKTWAKSLVGKCPKVARHSTACLQACIRQTLTIFIRKLTVALEVQTLKVTSQTRTASGRAKGFGGVCFMVIVISC
jgi:hypothetical protein